MSAETKRNGEPQPTSPQISEETLDRIDTQLDQLEVNLTGSQNSLNGFVESLERRGEVMETLLESQGKFTSKIKQLRDLLARHPGSPGT